MKNTLILVCAVITGMLVGYALGRDVDAEKVRLNAFYEQYCIALPGQTSIMKWVGGKPICTRSEHIKHGSNLKDWRE